MPGVAFDGHAVFAIRPREEGSLSPVIRFTSTTESSSAPFVLGASGYFDEAQFHDLVSGARFDIGVTPNPRFYVVFMRTNAPNAMRPFVSAQLVLERSAAVLTLGLGGDYSIESPVPTVEWTSTFEIRGQVVIGCSTLRNGLELDDPMWSSDFCRAVRSDFGLDAWLAATL